MPSPCSHWFFMGVANVLDLCKMEFMARETVQVYFDDLTGEPVEADEVQTIKFAWEGKALRLDLNQENADKLEQLMKPYLDAATLVTSSEIKKAPKPRRTDLNEVRSWAREQGMTVSDRGRVPIKVLDAYDNRNKGQDGAKSDKIS